MDIDEIRNKLKNIRSWLCGADKDFKDIRELIFSQQQEIERLKGSLDLINKDIYGTMGSSLDKDRYFKLRELCTNHL